MATTTDKADAGRIELRNGDSWVTMSLSLAEDFTGGSVVRVSPETRIALEAGDDRALSYTNKNWLSGVASGAFHAFRAMKTPRRVVHIESLNGRLCASDIQVLAHATANLIARIVHLELPAEPIEGWQIVDCSDSRNGTPS